eukprot:scaffold4017_cov199-Ochromonas_danica.AAC.2
MLGRYQIWVGASSSETSLISLLQDLPHLNSLRLDQVINNQYSDATLSAIIVHAKSLTELFVTPDYNNQYGRSISDKQLGELIEHCPSLERLAVLSCGLEIVIAALKHSNVNNIHLAMDRNVSEDMLDRVLLDKKVKWSSTLEVGSVGSFANTFSYKFNKEDRHWSKDKRN